MASQKALLRFVPPAAYLEAVTVLDNFLDALLVLFKNVLSTHLRHHRALYLDDLTFAVFKCITTAQPAAKK